MKITDFKAGDIITRIEPSNKGDCSYMGARLKLLGHRDGLSVVEGKSKVMFDDMKIIFPHYFWLEGWDYYPEDLMGEEKGK